MIDSKFDDIRPYIDDEIPAAMSRIAASEYFPAIAGFVFPEKKLSEAQETLCSYANIHDFQLDAMYAFNKQVLTQTAAEFTYSGTDYLDSAKSYLFVSNHRDIVLDSSLLQFALHLSGHRTTEITFGSNLMTTQLVIDIGRSNKMFKVMRGENPRDFYKTSLHLSEYIRHTITRRGESIWIAQRSGRTKDGNDATDQGILKMFNMSGGKDVASSLHELNIAPVAISYQWEPCDFFKTREMFLSRNGEKYIKEKNEDFISILTGITQPKGNIHISVCEPLHQEELQSISNGKSSNDFYKNVVDLMDKRIYSNYKLHDTNYIAHDIRSNTQQFASYYTPEIKEKFLHHLHQASKNVEGDINSILLGIYANPVDNCFGK